MIETSNSLNELVGKLEKYKTYKENSLSDADVWYNKLQIQRIRRDIKDKAKELLLLTQKN